MLTEPTEVSNLQPFILEAIKFVKEEIQEEIPKDNHGNAECSYENLSTAIKTEVFLEDTGNEQQDKDPYSTVKNIKQETLDEYDVTYQLVKFWPAETNISGNSEQNQTLQEVIPSGKPDNIRTEQGCDVSASIRLSSGDHYNQSPVNTALKCSITETNVLWTETENKYSIQETVASCGRSLSQCGSDAGDTDENNYVCDICSKVFLQESELNVHKLTHSEFQCNDCDTEVCQHKSIDKSYQCDICDKTFSHEHYLEQHKETHRPGLKYKWYKCNGCSVAFNTFNKLKDHKYHHCESRKYQCMVCDKLFETSYAVESHYKLVHNIGNNYKCDVCNKECKTENHLSAHMAIHKGKLKYKCKLCFKNFRKFSALKAHGVVHISRDHKCDMCNKAYKTAENLSQHKLAHGHQKNATPNRLLQSTSLHRDDTNKPSLIDMSDDFEKRKLRNQAVHINIRKHKCDLCDKAFVRAHDMVRHRLRHGSKKSDLSLACLSLDSDKNKAVTGTSNQKVGKYKCNQCKKSFSRAHILSQHMSSFHNHDSDPRKHKCSLCDKAFTRADTLFQHKLLHRRNNNDIRKYKCNICDKIYLTGYSLRRHELSVHKNEKNSKQKVLDSNSEMSDNVPHVTFNSDNSDFNKVEFKTGGIQPEHKAHTYIMYGDNKNYECSVCNKTLASSYSLWRHWRALHSSKRDITKYKCDICDSDFLWAHSLKRHMLSVHRKKCRSNKVSKHISFHKDDSNKAYTSGDSSEFKLCHQVRATGKRKFKCDLCGKGFLRVGHVTRHKLSVHRKEKNAKAKEIWSSTSELSDNLPQHVSFGHDNSSYINEKESPIDRSPAECGVRKYENHGSDKSLGLQKTVGHSIRSSINNNECNICGKVFSHNSSMKRHKLSVHKNEENNKQKEVLSGNLEQHVSFNHDDNKNDKNKGEFADSNSAIYNEAEYDSMKHKCNVCGKIFRWPYLMKRHKLSMHRNKKHEGNKIGYSIRSSNTNNKCNICGKVFSQNSSVKRHKLSVHKIEESNRQKEVLSGISEPRVSFNHDNKSDINEIEFAVNNSAIYNEAENDSMKKHKCNVCGKAFTWPYTMKRHKLSVHRNKKRGGNKVSQYSSHINDGNNKSCLVADKSPELELHNQVASVDHVDINYKCNICGKAFRWSSSLYRHKSTVHRNKKYWANKVSQYSSHIVTGNEKASVIADKSPELKLHNLVVLMENVDRKYKCNFCSQAFMGSSDLSQHILSVHRNKNHEGIKVSQNSSNIVAGNNKSCTVADTSPELKLHEQVVPMENVDGKYKCNFCEKAFKWSYSLEQHKLSVHRNIKIGGNEVSQNSSHIDDGNNKTCIVADKLPELKTDKQVMPVGNVDKMYKCNLCCETFVLNYNLIQHKLATHGITSSIGQNKCNICGKTFSKSAYLTAHKFTLHGINNGVRNYKCNICDKIFLWIQNLKRHELLVHKNQRKYKCDLCEKDFTRANHVTTHMLSAHRKKDECYKVQSGLSQHISFHSVDKTETAIDSADSVEVGMCDKKFEAFTCDICGRKFKKPHNLLQHKVVHMNVKYNCKICNKSFSEPDILLQHMSLHRGSGKNHQCNVCNKVYTSAYHLKRHKVLHNKVKMFKCDMCDRMFAKTFNLLQHKLTDHNVVREYNCDVCDRGFVTAELLSQHVSLHSDDNCHHCDICNMVYIKHEHLVQHRLTHNHC